MCLIVLMGFDGLPRLMDTWLDMPLSCVGALDSIEPSVALVGFTGQVYATVTLYHPVGTMLPTSPALSSDALLG